MNIFSSFLWLIEAEWVDTSLARQKKYMSLHYMTLAAMLLQKAQGAFYKAIDVVLSWCAIERSLKLIVIRQERTLELL